MILTCLLVFAVIVVADYLVQRKAAQDAQARALPTPASAPPRPTPTAVPDPTPTAIPSSSSDIDLEAGIVEPGDDDYDVAAERPKPTATIPSDVQSAGRESERSDARTEQATPRVAKLVSAHDVLSVGSRKREDSRRYRFTLDGTARVSGAFSATGGGVTVRIFSSSATVYLSGFSVSSDTIDIELPAGSYELLVMLVGTETEIVGFSVDVSALHRRE